MNEELTIWDALYGTLWDMNIKDVKDQALMNCLILLRMKLSCPFCKKGIADHHITETWFELVTFRACYCTNCGGLFYIHDGDYSKENRE